MHHFDTAAFVQCVEDGAQPTDSVNTFVHNPAGPFAVRLQEIRYPNGPPAILE